MKIRPSQAKYLFLVIATKCTWFVISVFFSPVIDHDPPTQIRVYYGVILTFDNYGRPSFRVIYSLKLIMTTLQQ